MDVEEQIPPAGADRKRRRNILARHPVVRGYLASSLFTLTMVSLAIADAAHGVTIYIQKVSGLFIMSQSFILPMAILYYIIVKFKPQMSQLMVLIVCVLISSIFEFVALHFVFVRPQAALEYIISGGFWIVGAASAGLFYFFSVRRDRQI